MPRGRCRIGETEYPYFLTGTVVGRLPVFTRPEAVQIVLRSLRTSWIVAAPYFCSRRLLIQLDSERTGVP